MYALARRSVEDSSGCFGLTFATGFVGMRHDDHVTNEACRRRRDTFPWRRDSSEVFRSSFLKTSMIDDAAMSIERVQLRTRGPLG